VFAAQRPSDQEIARHYDGYPRTDFDSPITRQRYRELLRDFEPYRGTGRILDVGCGIGFFLEEARDAGWEALGTEYGQRPIDIARSKGLSVVDASTGPLSFDPASFDVITAFEVLEHLRDPVAEVETAARLVRPGGLFYCTTPNFDSLSRRLLRERWSVIEYPEHLNYFTVSTLSRLLERAGFRTHRVLTSGLDIARLRRPSSSAQGSAVTASTEDLRARVEESKALRASKRMLNAALSAARAGDSLKGWFERR
jgi:SAM-dependent methyltransferase